MLTVDVKRDDSTKGWFVLTKVIYFNGNKI